MPLNGHRTGRNALSLAGGMLASALVVAPAVAAADQRVVATGVQVDYGDKTNRYPGSPMGGPAFTVDDICRNADTLGFVMNTMLIEMDSAAAQAGSPITVSSVERMPGAPNRYDVALDLENARRALCEQPEPEAQVLPFTISYSSCRMTMSTMLPGQKPEDPPGQEMSIALPSGGGSAFMWMVDRQNREVIYLELDSSLDAVSATMGQGWSQGATITPLGGRQEIFGYDAREYSVEYTGGMGMPGADANVPGAGNLGQAIKVTSAGTAWLSQAVPGIDIVRSFYENLTNQVQPGEGTSFFGGLLMNQVKMLEYGLPIVIDQTTTSSVMGRTAVSGRTESHIANVRVLPLEADWCAVEMTAPEGYKVTNINEQMSEAFASADMSSEDVAAAMQEYEAAMEQLSPEEKAMLQNMGMGNMMDQLTGGAAAAGAPGSASAASGAAATGAAGAAAAGAAGSGVGPTSASLTTGNTTETVQKHLEALGYDPGGADGELSVTTQIAISEFQADHGLAVTGEVSPQLIGILSAEVDKRAGR